MGAVGGRLIREPHKGEREGAGLYLLMGLFSWRVGRFQQPQ